MVTIDDKICIFIIVPDDGMAAELSAVLRDAGFSPDFGDLAEEMVNCFHEYNTMIFRFPDTKMSSSSFIRTVLSTLKNTLFSSCYIITIDRFVHLTGGLKKSKGYYSGKRSKQKTLDEIEREHIIRTLDENKWKYGTTAKLLGINRSTLYRKMIKYGLGKKDS